MRHYLLLLLALVCFAKCDKETTAEKIFKSFEASKAEFPADGESKIAFSVELDKKTSADRRSVIFSASSGSFVGGTNKITAKAEFVDGALTAKATLRAPFSPGEIEVTVQPEFDSPIKEHILTKQVVATLSKPASITLTPSGSGLGANGISEIYLNGVVKNADGNFVSEGVEVKFYDGLVPPGTAGGIFREINNKTQDSGRVSAWYGAGAVPVGATVKIGVIVLENGVETDISDVIFVQINHE